MLSIVTSLYKSENYLRSFTKSLIRFSKLMQGRADFELIVISNEPTKAEKFFLLKFSQKSWFRFQTVSREPLYASWNRGVELARGESIGFWNVDDIRTGGACLEAIKMIEAGADLVYFPFTIKWYVRLAFFDMFIKKKEIYPHKFDATKFTTGMNCGPFFIFSKDFYNKVGPFDEQFKIAGDFDWCVRAAKLSNRFYLSKENAGIFKVDGAGLSAGSKFRLRLENYVVFKRHAISIEVDGVSDRDINNFNIRQLKYKGKYINFS